MPVVMEVRPNVYKKNVQAAHVYGVRGKAARHQAGLGAVQRDSFKHMILLCLPHHSAVDDRVTGEQDYPPELLLKWKTKREGKDKAVLDRIVFPTGEPEALINYLESVFEPPVKRLEALAQQLQETGELTAGSLVELNRIIAMMHDSPGVDARSASQLMQAAELFGNLHLEQTAGKLLEAAEMMTHLPRGSQEW